MHIYDINDNIRYKNESLRHLFFNKKYILRHSDNVGKLLYQNIVPWYLEYITANMLKIICSRFNILRKHPAVDYRDYCDYVCWDCYKLLLIEK